MLNVGLHAYVFGPNAHITRSINDLIDHFGRNIETLKLLGNFRTHQLIKQFTRLFEIEGIELKFDPSVYDFMVEKALEYKLGARGLRSICESILTDAMYELPSQKVKNFDVTLEYAQRKFSTSKLSLLKVA